MNNRTALYYILSGPVYYQVIKDRRRLQLLKKEVLKEEIYFFEKRYVIRESWHKRYFKILIAVFSVNLIARMIERKISRSHSVYQDNYSKFAFSTMLALREYNNNRSFFNIETEEFIMLKDLIKIINDRVNMYCNHKKCHFNTLSLIHSNTPLGIEIEFTNKGSKAGKFFENKQKDALFNFSKYHFYHLIKFMWRFGAYVDSEMPFKQFIRKGGFLEYTFTRPDIAFKPSQPLTSSPALAARLIEESIRFTPVRPHSLHITFQIDENSKKLPVVSYEELFFMMICTGHFENTGKGLIETRISEGNMKDWAVIRDRRNDKGWVKTVEFTHMRACRSFVKRGVYEPAILLLLAYKNLFNFENVEGHSSKLREWAKAPSVPSVNIDFMLEKVYRGLSLEVSLPEHYKKNTIKLIRKLYDYNKSMLDS
ncbi:MAG: hypothetical protein C0602_07030 [Denitrovibrio sp.]|nr:MAG: hypothetical protein C0602_07030 [Denitrovibrio sp.]